MSVLRLLPLLLALPLALPALANMGIPVAVGPASVAQLLAWRSAGASLLVVVALEAWFLVRAERTGPVRALLVSLLVNAVSTFAGWFLLVSANEMRHTLGLFVVFVIPVAYLAESAFAAFDLRRGHRGYVGLCLAVFAAFLVTSFAATFLAVPQTLLTHAAVERGETATPYSAGTFRFHANRAPGRMAGASNGAYLLAVGLLFAGCFVLNLVVEARLFAWLLPMSPSLWRTILRMNLVSYLVLLAIGLALGMKFLARGDPTDPASYFRI